MDYIAIVDRSLPPWFHFWRNVRIFSVLSQLQLIIWSSITDFYRNSTSSKSSSSFSSSSSFISQRRTTSSCSSQRAVLFSSFSSIRPMGGRSPFEVCWPLSAWGLWGETRFNWEVVSFPTHLSNSLASEWVCRLFPSQLFVLLDENIHLLCV